MKNPKEVKLSRGAVHITTMVSVSLLLLIIGAVSLLGIAANHETRRLKENVELNIVMCDTVSDAQASALMEDVRRQPYINTISLIDKATALKNWTADTGEDLEALFGFNPLSPEIRFTLTADYASAKSVNAICATLGKLPGVESVAAPDAEMVDAMNKHISHIILAMGCVALMLVVISFVLINNTVHLSIYSKRFTIHTMQLVGATNGFVRRPLLKSNLVVGILAGVLASAILAGVMASTDSLFMANIARFIPWEEAGVVFAGIIAAGALICVAAAFISATRYLRKDYDELFR
jgi:cell division transport system permease protein